MRFVYIHFVCAAVVVFSSFAMAANENSTVIIDVNNNYPIEIKKLDNFIDAENASNTNQAHFYAIDEKTIICSKKPVVVHHVYMPYNLRDLGYSFNLKKRVFSLANIQVSLPPNFDVSVGY